MGDVRRSSLGTGVDGRAEGGKSKCPHGLNCGDTFWQVCTAVAGTFKVILGHCNGGLRRVRLARLANLDSFLSFQGWLCLCCSGCYKDPAGFFRPQTVAH